MLQAIEEAVALELRAVRGARSAGRPKRSASCCSDRLLLGAETLALPRGPQRLPDGLPRMAWRSASVSPSRRWVSWSALSSSTVTTPSAIATATTLRNSSRRHRRSAVLAAAACSAW